MKGPNIIIQGADINNATRKITQKIKMKTAMINNNTRAIHAITNTIGRTIMMKKSAIKIQISKSSMNEKSNLAISLLLNLSSESAPASLPILSKEYLETGNIYFIETISDYNRSLFNRLVRILNVSNFLSVYKIE